MGHWKCYFLISTITSYVIAVSDISLSTSLLNRASTKVLSRKRRFFIPQTSGWNLRFVLNTNSVNYLKIVIAGRLIIRLPLCSKFIPCSKIKIRLYHCFTFFLYIFRGIFDTIIPVEGGAGGPILLRLPITYNIDKGRYVPFY